MAIFAKFKLFNRQLTLAALLIAVSTFNYGFDNQAFATTQAMDAFARQFGDLDENTGRYALEPSWLSLFNSINYVGFAFGVLMGSFISARWGRRWCMFTMSCYALITATIAVTSQNKHQIMAARVLNYVYVGMELAVIPTFQSEIVPAPARGFMVGTYQLSLGIGGLVINCVCFGTSKIPDNKSWRIPLGLFYIVPTIILSLVWFIPESPRWLLRKQRDEEALQNLRKLREGCYTEQQIHEEFHELKTSLDKEVEQGRFVELFRGTNIKRTLIVVGVNAFQQLSGQAFASQYGTIYVKSLGTINPFAFGLINSSINIVTMICILLLADHVGRRALLALSSCVMTAAMMIMGGLGVDVPVTVGRKNGIVSMISIFACGFSLGWAPMTYVVATEVSALRLRDLTARVGFTVNVIFNFAVNFMIPYLIYDKYAGLNSKVGFIFAAIMVISLGFIYFCVPECKGKTLEQVDFLFHEGVRLRDFAKIDAAALMRESGNATDKKDDEHA
ncbi:Major facilitator-type transporter ecdD [Paramyrothecium foliicola]|nr:Major facilitator-type transporter ecdD [Paramyrothecium foliicola]